jgi:hypothetical protein
MEPEQLGDGSPEAKKRAEYEAILAPLRAQYDGRVKAYPVGKYGLLVVRYATGTEMRFWQKRVRAATNAVPRHEEALDLADGELVTTCALHPERQQVQLILEDYPTLSPKVSRDIIALSGEGIQELGKG